MPNVSTSYRPGSTDVADRAAEGETDSSSAGASLHVVRPAAAEVEDSSEVRLPAPAPSTFDPYDYIWICMDLVGFTWIYLGVY
jgi:hypothetical protein